MPTDPKTQITGFIILDINSEQFTLSGTIGNTIVVSYHREFKDAPSLGTLEGALKSITGAFHVDPTAFDAALATAKSALIGPLATILTAITTAQVRITDLGIDTTGDGAYEIGFALDFRTVKDPIKVGDITLQAFGLRLKANGKK